jgi:dienelactone hydrolase
MKIILETLTIDHIPALTACPDGARRCPVVFLLHGFGSRKEDLLDLAWRLAGRGFFAVAFDAVHHGARADSTLERLDDPQRCTYPVESGLDRYLLMHQVVVETGCDLAVLLDRLAADERADVARCGVTGVSMGAFSAYYAAANESRIAAAAPVIGMPAFAERWDDVTLEASTYDQWRAQMDVARPATGRHAEFMRNIDPSPRLATFYPRPLFMLCGDLDTQQPKSYTLRLYRSLLPVYVDHPDRLKLKIYDGVGHELSPGMMEDVANWFADRLIPSISQSV